jgi:hypothetical protein
MRFACGTRVGNPAAVKSPRTGSAMIWAACFPTAHPSDPEGPLNWPRPSGIPGVGSDPAVGSGPAVGSDPAVGSGPAVSPVDPLPLPLPLPVADDERLRNQSDTAVPEEAAAPAGTVSRGPVAAGSGMITSRRWLAGWASGTDRTAMAAVAVVPRDGKPA